MGVYKLALLEILSLSTFYCKLAIRENNNGSSFSSSQRVTVNDSSSGTSDLPAVLGMCRLGEMLIYEDYVSLSIDTE